MRKFLTLASLSSLALAACTASGQMSLDDFLQNPLYADRYYEDLAVHMADFTIQNDPLMQDAEMKDIVEQTRLDALEKAKEIDAIMKEGIVGGFMSDTDEVWGRTLLIGNTLYFSPDFITAPGIDLHVYLSPRSDPRQPDFPGEQDLDLGTITSAYSSHSITVPDDAVKDGTLQTVVLYDKALKRIYGFSVMGPM